MTRGPNVGAMVRRLVAVYRGTDQDTRAQGASWYVQARVQCKAMARESGCTVATACGVMAALSPRLTWTRNVRAAREVLRGERPAGVFSSSYLKALRIQEGARPLAVLRGPKVRAFYRALTGDEGAAVIDVWVLRVLGWTRRVTDRAYAAMARALQLAARSTGTTTVRLQATAWVAVRGRA